MYIFYQQISTEEHYLLATEIAEMYGIYHDTEKRTPHAKLVKSIINSYKRQNSLPSDPIFFMGGIRPVEVYPAAQYGPAIHEFLSGIDKTRVTHVCTFPDGQKEKFQYVSEEYDAIQL
jgi:hypothetical protein